MSNDFPVLFIGGHRKAGTTLCRNLFDGHPELVVYPVDINVLYAYFPKYLSAAVTNEQRLRRLERVVCQDLPERLGDGAADGTFDPAEFCRSFLAGLNGEALCDMRQVIAAQLRAFRESAAGKTQPAPRWHVAKETSIEIYAEEIFAWFPEARFLHILRDPRDNYAALKSGVAGYYGRFGEDEKVTLFSLVHRALLGFKAALVNQAGYGEARYSLLRFEDLVRDPEPSLRRACDWLGIGFDRCVLAPTVLGRPTRGNSFDGVDFSAISARHVGSWRERITPDEAKVIEFHFGDLMPRFGYDPAFKPGAAMAAAAEFYKWANYKYFYFDRFAA